MKTHRNEIGKGKTHQPRGTTAQRGYDSRWQRYAKAFLAAHPLCECHECKELYEREGIVTPSEVVDHIKPHKGDMGLFWDTANHQAMSKRCHDRKTQREDGGSWARRSDRS